VAAATAVTLLVASIAATWYSNTYDHDDPRLYGVVAQLAREGAPALDKHQPYLIKLESDTGLFGSTVAQGLLGELWRRGYDMRVKTDDPYLARSHVAPADARPLVLRIGKSVFTDPDPGQRIAYVTSATASDRAQVARADANLRARLRAPSTITGRGRAVAATHRGEDADALASLSDPSFDPLTLIASGDLTRLRKRGLVQRGVFTTKQFRAYQRAHDLVDAYVFALYRSP
jgi:hypothetical protein